jgi:predicted dehydrogenase
MFKIQVHVASPRRTLYLDAIARMPEVELVEEGADALVTDTAGDPSLPTLLDAPEEGDPTRLSTLEGASLMPAHEWRFAPNVIPVQESRSQGQLGEPGLLRIHYWLAQKKCPRTVSFHQIDLAHWFFSSPPDSVYCHACQDYLLIHLGYPDGGMALVDVATARPGTTDYHSMHLIGSGGAAYADDHENTHLLLGKAEATALIQPVNAILTIQNMLEEFVAGIRESRPWSVNLQDTLHVLATLKEVSHA